MEHKLPCLLGCNTKELEQIAIELGEPAYRGRQIARWIYRKQVDSLDAMSDLPAAFRARLAAHYVLGWPQVVHREVAADGTIKYLLRLEDGQSVESVYLPYPDRVSACLSTQVGCPAGCRFCATAQGGLARNLTAGEIVGQYLVMQRESPRRISHVVYMGMGEPLWNYEATVKSLRLLGGEVGLSMRNLTVSTVGVVPGILALAKEDLPITLALSLHAPDDALRARLIPTARKWKLDEILAACAEYARITKRNLTFEYLLIGGVNDSPEQARALAALLERWKLPGNVNLIPFNYVETPEGFRRPTREAIARFREALVAAGRVTTQRMTRGDAINAACGQLRRRMALSDNKTLRVVSSVPRAMLSSLPEPT
ncbi:23S rRNA m(2)A-2503 methyltransferase [Chthonomonas calidirosea]|uniref:23S rRNA (adenine(2503)-C(2))-methyltransferase RlmN n=1 Tax=Chthonomonas calidirosea TaxID=454171 RepID=UPI0006DD4FBA|nr:23S rRNA (adenine(2503)-C(2))-methyltransferase RlmN [Chthonomonas calidirosea]CEK18296.1 23S rRNA m(2)A-2503 methyltransferase [Chthonomonas calidirosea]